MTTLGAIGSASLPFTNKPARASIESLTRIQQQARLQLEARTTRRLVHEMLPLVVGEGLHRLPEPSHGDIFCDIEGDPFAGEAGQEYLFGYVHRGDADEWHYTGHWALDAAREKEAFETFIAFVMARWARFPDLHVYHYATYEASAVRRLMGKDAVCEDEVDRLLRAGVFVDLHAIVRQAVRASVERYSIKDLEHPQGRANAGHQSEARRAGRGVGPGCSHIGSSATCSRTIPTSRSTPPT